MASMLRTRQLPEIDVQASSPISCPKVMSLQSLEWREVGLSLLWPAISYRPHQCDQYLCCQNIDVDFHTPLVPLHHTFHYWSNMDTLVNIQRIAQNILFSQPRGVSNWSDSGSVTDNIHFVVLSLSHSYPEFVPLGWGWHILPAQFAQLYKGECPLQEWWEKAGFGEELMSIMSTDSWQGMKGHHLQPSIPLHMGPPSHWSLHFPLLLVGISFGQDQVTCSQQNGFILFAIVPLLSLSLRCGLYLHFLEGFSQSFTLLGNVIVNTSVFLHAPYCREVKVDGKAWSAPKHQVMWAVASNGWSHRVVSMYQLW